jgi:hypothetical protein
MPMNRRSQQAIAFRSDRAAARLRLLTRDGRSQVSVIEEALAGMPVPDLRDDRKAELLAEIKAIQQSVAKSGHRIPTMAEFDALEYDENGNCR